MSDPKRSLLPGHLVRDTELNVALGSYRELADTAITDADIIVVDHVEQ